MSVRPVLLALLAVAVSPVAVTAAPQDNKVFITYSSTTDTPAKANQASSEAQAVASAMKNFTAEAFQNAYACSQPLTIDDVGDLLGHERRRQLLGAEANPDLLAQVGQGVGARYVVSVTVTQLNGRDTITIVMVDTKTTKVVSRSTMTVPIGPGLVDAIDAFSKKFVADLASSSYPKCPGEWSGTVTVTVEKSAHGVAAGTGKPFDDQSSLTVSCSVSSGASRDSKCSVSYSGSTSGNGASITSNAGGSVVTSAGASVSPTEASVSIGVVQVEGTMNVQIPGAGGSGGPQTFTFGPWSAKGPSSGDPKHSSGSWSDGKGTKISWSFSRK